MERENIDIIWSKRKSLIIRLCSTLLLIVLIVVLALVISSLTI